MTEISSSMKAPKSVFITGATGYLGSHITKELLAQGYKVKALARKQSIIPSLLIGEPVEWVRIKETSNAKSLIDSDAYYGIECIIHCATNYGRVNVDFIEQLEANLFLPLHLLYMADKHNILYFVNTDTLLDKRVSIYSRSKDQFSDWIKSGVGSTRSVNCVLEHFYGPNDDATKFVSWLLKELLFSDGDINLTKGLQKRDFIYISDVVSAFIFIIKNIHMICKDKNYVEIEVGSGQSLPLRHVVELCAGLCAANYDRLKFGALPYRENEMMNIDVNIEPLIDLGWASNVPLVEGLRKTINSTKWNG